MFNVKLNGNIPVLVNNSKSKNFRPVFHEELDLLGFDRYIDYPKTEEPLLWASGRNYYYNGKSIALTKGGTIYTPPKIDYKLDNRIHVEPVDMDSLISMNIDKLRYLEDTAKNFIFNVYKDRYDESIIVSYSGGKDSQVVLDLASQVIPPSDLKVFFSDTSLENKYTYANVNETINRYSQFDFTIVNPFKSFDEVIDYANVPSRFKRWCTPILKVSPIKNVLSKYKNVIVIEGVRRDESARRKEYKAVERDAVISGVTNIRPILDWNVTEVFLYIFWKRLNLNKSYRIGLSRVGCILCPFATTLTEFYNYHIEPERIKRYLPYLEQLARINGVDVAKINESIENGHWKKRAGGLGHDPISNVILSEDKSSCKGFIFNPSQDFFEWIKPIGEVICSDTNGTIKVDDHPIKFRVKNFSNNNQTIEMENINNRIVKSKLKKVLLKTGFCISCGRCIVDCPGSAISSDNGRITIDSTKCVNCHTCLDFNIKGCLIAFSVHNSLGRPTKHVSRTLSVNKYFRIGFKSEWLESLFRLNENWYCCVDLNLKDIEIATRWFIDMGVIDGRTKDFTQIGEYLKEIYKNDEEFVYGVILDNLYKSSIIISWYMDNIPWDTSITRDELKERITESMPNYTEGTINNFCEVLFDFFKNEKIPTGIIKGNYLKKVPFKKIDPYLVAYSLYNTGYDEICLKELFDPEFRGGPHKIFGLKYEEILYCIKILERKGLVRFTQMGRIVLKKLSYDLILKMSLNEATK